MCDKTITILGNSNPDSQYNYNRMAILSEKLKGNNVIVIDDGEEYKSICDALGIKRTTKKNDRLKFA